MATWISMWLALFVVVGTGTGQEWSDCIIYSLIVDGNYLCKLMVWVREDHKKNADDSPNFLKQSPWPLLTANALRAW